MAQEVMTVAVTWDPKNITSGSLGSKHGDAGSPLMHPASKNQVQKMEERHKNKTSNEERETMKIGSEKLNPVKYQSE